MEIQQDFSSAATVAQIVRPYDPNSAPPAVAEKKYVPSPVFGLVIASLIVLVIIVWTLRKRRKARR